MNNEISGKDIIELANLEEEYKEKILGDPKSEKNIFPNSWVSLEYVKIKNKFLKECIETNTPLDLLEDYINYSINRNWNIIDDNIEETIKNRSKNM